MSTDIAKSHVVLSFLPPASSDYTTESVDLTFNAGSTNQTVMIPITGDTVVESTKSFTVSLTTGDGTVMLNPRTTTVTIQDDDSEFLVHTYMYEIGVQRTPLRSGGVAF